MRQVAGQAADRGRVGLNSCLRLEEGQPEAPDKQSISSIENLKRAYRNLFLLMCLMRPTGPSVVWRALLYPSRPPLTLPVLLPQVAAPHVGARNLVKVRLEPVKGPRQSGGVGLSYEPGAQVGSVAAQYPDGVRRGSSVGGEGRRV